MSKQGWIGVDLDGTLAHYVSGQGVRHVGEPIPAMVKRVKQWRAQGIEVRIMTARVCGMAGPEDRAEQVAMIELWCLKHLGEKLPVTHEKDFSMVELWDDRAVGVVANTGLTKAQHELDELKHRLSYALDGLGSAQGYISSVLGDLP